MPPCFPILRSIQSRKVRGVLEQVNRGLVLTVDLVLAIHEIFTSLLLRKKNLMAWTSSTLPLELMSLTKV